MFYKGRKPVQTFIKIVAVFAQEKKQCLSFVLYLPFSCNHCFWVNGVVPRVLESGTWVMDTPGLREIGVLAMEDGIDETFDGKLTVSSTQKINGGQKQ